MYHFIIFKKLHIPGKSGFEPLLSDSKDYVCVATKLSHLGGSLAGVNDLMYAMCIAHGDNILARHYNRPQV